MEIFVTVIGQKLKVAGNEQVIISGSRRFIKLIFTLPTDWKSLTVYVRFTQGDVSYKSILDLDNSCYFPSSFSSGKCTLMLYGVGGAAGSIIATTEDLEFTIEESSYTNPDMEDDDADWYDENYIATVSETRQFLNIN